MPYAQKVADALTSNRFRIEVDDSSNSFNKKIREAVTNKIPNIVIVGGKEAEQGTVTLRRYCVKEQLTLPLDGFLARMQKLRSEKIMDNLAETQIG